MESDRFSNEAARIGEFRRRNVRHVQCRSCGFEPSKEGTPASCPKCGSGCWETFVRVGKLRPAGQARMAKAIATASPPTPPPPPPPTPPAPAGARLRGRG